MSRSEEARKRYGALIATAIRDAATRSDEVGRTVRPELGDGVFSWHLAQSRMHSPPQRVGKRLPAPLDDRHSARRGTYRVIYRIYDEQRSVTVLDVAHRRDAYRAHH